MEAIKVSSKDNERMRYLVEILNSASRAYYSSDKEEMDNLTYDNLYDELSLLEKNMGIVLSSSPTARVGYEVVSNLPKKNHKEKMLSLDKTKSIDEIKEFLKDQQGVISWKLDGLTVVMTYENGKLVSAVTRGNGEIGEVITPNAKKFKNIPLEIPFKGTLIIRGEAVITYDDFYKINSSLGLNEQKYKNPRNLCSGSVRQLDSKVTKNRNVKFFAFSIVEKNEETVGEVSENSIYTQMQWMEKQGFEVVENYKVTISDVEEKILYFEKKIEQSQVPSDGLVLVYDDIDYGKKLGTTSKFPRNAIAFKWKDEVAETVLREIKWSASRTGLINPIAVFDTVELEGTSVSRASLHNISIMKELKIGVGDVIEVFKANMIIPQIKLNKTQSNYIAIPEKCPVCQEKTTIKKENNIEVLVCENPHCIIKKIKSIAHFVGKNAMDIDGLSQSTIEKFIDAGIVKEYGDIFKIKNYKDEIVNMEGFGEKSFMKLSQAVELSKKTTPSKLLFSLGIDNIGIETARLISNYCNDDWNTMIGIDEEKLKEINGIGEIVSRKYIEYFSNPDNKRIVESIISNIEFIKQKKENELFFEGLVFVITGSLNHYENRNKMKEEIQLYGGKVSSSISKNTSFLINNDLLSNSGKNKKAKEIGIPIISEEDFISKVRSKNQE